MAAKNFGAFWVLQVRSPAVHTLCSEKNTHSRFLLYLSGKCFDLHKIFRVCLRGVMYSADIKIKYSLLRVSNSDVIFTCLLIIRFEYNEYSILTSMECLIPHKHTVKILYKSIHFPPR